MAKWIRIFLITIIVCLNFQHVEAQEESFIVQIVDPGEGETIYAGPSSLLFSIPVSGYVQNSKYDFDKISLSLEVIKDGQLIGSLDETLTHYDTYDFYLTANEEATDDEFDPMHASCVAYCHVRSDLSLPAGNVLLRVTAKAPNGDSVTAERNIIVDHSNYVDVPVKVVFDDGSSSPASGIPIKASTWLYMWRARSATGSSDDQGNAFVKVETLAEVPTHWVFSVPPVIIDGIWYESTDSVELTINPGTNDPSTVLLKVTSQKGEIRGKLTNNMQQELALKAVQLSTGDIFETISSTDGNFSFPDLLIDRYVLLVDLGVDQGNKLAYPQLVDLTVDPEVNINIPVLQLSGRTVNGSVVDEQNSSIPFAWVTIENSNYVQSILPESGAFSILGLTGERLIFQTRSPGYFSHETSLSLENSVDSALEIQLKPLDDTQFLSWGSGRVTLPAESEYILEGNVVTVDKGWIWGSGNGSEWIVRSATTEIKMTDASFAYELLPGQGEWLFVFEGSADIRNRSSQDFQKINGNQMVNLTDKQAIMVIPYDPELLTALRPTKSVPVSFIREETMLEKVKGFLKSLGTNLAQFIVYAVYVAGFIMLVFFPLKFFIQWVKKKRLPS